MSKRKALVLIFPGYCEFEIAVAISMLRRTHDIFTCALQDEPCRSEAGLVTVSDFKVSDLQQIEEFEILLIPGGDLKPIADHEELFSWVRKFSEAGKVVGAICSGIYVLAKANLLNDCLYTATLSREQRHFLGGFKEENFRYQPTVVSNKIVTAQGHGFVQFGIDVSRLVKEVSMEEIDFYQGRRNSYMEGEGEVI
ncbi:DJ-1/PfpI family protein [Litchfieldia alkalitelluris]|uniref:DJ-1/PfpI family protein n=1 Tax=Litchfieldia alkalitelluris TaxID=304268 RepID=UPI000997019B|nr:DJ-1/PfpI family protein [Litchfieldia alkalitelluris]